MSKKLIYLLFFLFSNQLFAYQFLSDEEAKEQQIKIASSNLEAAQKAYFDKYSECIEQSKNNILSANDFKSIPLTEKELKSIISYYSSKNYKICVGELEDKYLLAINVARAFSVPNYSVKDDPESNKSINLASTLSIDEVAFYPDYMQIPESKRILIEKIPNINNVFDVKKSFKALKVLAQ